jgi:uncharacterized metal-binding protein
MKWPRVVTRPFCIFFMKQKGAAVYKCISCREHACFKGKPEKMPESCPGLEPEMTDRSRALYEEPQNKMIARAAAQVEAEGYGSLTRLEETMLFAQKCGYKKLGVASCIGLSKEAAVLQSVLESNGFEIESAICKNGGIPKEFLGLSENDKLRPGCFEAMCNPAGQALMLNQAGTELNIILGLCVGHDSLFIKYSEAPVTVFAVKDRVLAHNPMGAIYLAGGYYKSKLYK